MRLTAEQVKQGLLHPDLEVRDMALEYFQCSFSDDPSIMPLWIEAYDKYGWGQVSQYNWAGRPLVQSAETVLWLLERLDEPESARKWLWVERTDFFLGQLAAAPLELLAPHRDRISRIAGMDDETAVEISERLTLATMTPTEAWAALEELCEEESSAGIDEFDHPQGFRYVEVAARGGLQLQEHVLAILAERIELDDDNPKFFLQSFAANLAGRMRLIEAVPLLLDVLQAASDSETDDDWVSSLCADALVQIGTEDVIRAVAERFPEESSGFQIDVMPVFQWIHSDAAVKTAFELLANADEWDGDGFVGDILTKSLRFQFDPAAIEPLRERINDDPDGEFVAEMREGAVVIALLAGVNFPELPGWREQMHEATRESVKFWESYDDVEEPVRDWELPNRRLRSDDGGSFSALEDGIISFSEEAHQSERDPDSGPFVRADPQVGRNDPCPCGSGKKFKKCCLNRQ